MRAVLDQVAKSLQEAQYRAELGQADLYVAGEGRWMDPKAPLCVSVQAFDPRGDVRTTGLRTKLFESRACAGDANHALAGVPSEAGAAEAVVASVLAGFCAPDLKALLGEVRGEGLFTGGTEVRPIQARTSVLPRGLVVPVTLYHQGRPLLGGAMGLVVVPRGGTRVMRFYRSGESGGAWKLL